MVCRSDYFTAGPVDCDNLVAIIEATLLVEGKMKIASVKDRLSHYLKTAEKEDVVITKNGKPSAIIHHLGEGEIEDYLLEHDPKFRAKIEKRWKDYSLSSQAIHSDTGALASCSGWQTISTKLGPPCANASFNA